MSIWKLLRGRWGTGDAETDDVRVDRLSGALIAVDFEHHKSHEGKSFHVFVNASGGSGTKATATFTTPDTTEWAQMVVSMRTNVAAVFTFGEAATVTGASGADFVPILQNRNLATESSLISAGSAGGAGFITIDGTVTDFGTILHTEQVGSGKSGGENRAQTEFILKQNTTYAIEAESQAASSEVSLDLSWYEHTDRN